MRRNDTEPDCDWLSQKFVVVCFCLFGKESLCRCITVERVWMIFCPPVAECVSLWFVLSHYRLNLETNDRVPVYELRPARRFYTMYGDKYVNIINFCSLSLTLPRELLSKILRIQFSVIIYINKTLSDAHTRGEILCDRSMIFYASSSSCLIYIFRRFQMRKKKRKVLATSRERVRKLQRRQILSNIFEHLPKYLHKIRK